MEPSSSAASCGPSSSSSRRRSSRTSSSSSSRPTRPRSRQARRPRQRTSRAFARSCISTSRIYQQYGRWLWELVGHQSLGQSFANRQEVNDIIARAAPVTASLVFGGAVFWLMLSIPIGRDVGAPARARSSTAWAMVFVLIGISAHPVWIGLIFSYVFGYRLGLDADHRLLRLLQPLRGSGVRWARAVGLPHDPAVGDVRDPVRRALRPAHPRERDGDDERGLRAHGARQGRARAPGAALAHPPQQHAPDRHDPRHGHRSRARWRDLHRDDLRPSRSRPRGAEGATSASTCR